MAAAKSGFPALSLADSWFLVADPLLGAGLFFLSQRTAGVVTSVAINSAYL
jgi:hypothetical protein